MAFGKRNKKRSAYSNNKVRLVRGGSEYFAVFTDMIDKARDTIHLQTYIYDDDETGQRIAEALIRAASREVQVYMLVDGYASQALPDTFISSLKAAGIYFRFFEPLFMSRNFYFGRRLHNKILVIDASESLVGGVNITNRYNDMPGQPAWLDFGIHVQGPVSVELCEWCWQAWNNYSRRKKNVPCKPLPGPFPEKAFDGLVRMRRNDWVRNQLQISNSYLEMFKTATEKIYILSSYALPGNIFRKNIERAVKRGVKVVMIISGESDIMLVKYAERYWYDWLMRNSIEIYEYRKNVLHGKMALCDSEWMTVGSYNVNDLSAYASIELNLDVRDPEFVSSVEKTLLEIIKNDCELISKENMALHRNVFKRLAQWSAYTLIRFAFRLFTFYYRKQKN